MADKMTFPATFKEFAEQYKIVDKEEVYTNGAELIPIFRVEQWLDNENNSAKKIFEEIEKYLRLTKTTHIGQQFYAPLLDVHIAELKKKYTQDKGRDKIAEFGKYSPLSWKYTEDGE